MNEKGFHLFDPLAGSEVVVHLRQRAEGVPDQVGHRKLESTFKK
jgi:hypothetical protein